MPRINNRKAMLVAGHVFLVLGVVWQVEATPIGPCPGSSDTICTSTLVACTSGTLQQISGPFDDCCQPPPNPSGCNCCNYQDYYYQCFDENGKKIGGPLFQAQSEG